ncbi:hypothetical protein FHG87_020322 [Trinorchestia longiramus]|nr:hypothetical protein FHG87_020322 [Trinorchestia longiramus]
MISVVSTSQYQSGNWLSLLQRSTRLVRLQILKPKPVSWTRLRGLLWKSLHHKPTTKQISDPQLRIAELAVHLTAACPSL